MLRFKNIIDSDSYDAFLKSRFEITYLFHTTLKDKISYISNTGHILLWCSNSHIKSLNYENDFLNIFNKSYMK